MRGASIALTAMFIAGLATPAFADTTVSIVDVQESAVARALWDRIAKDYEAEHKGVIGSVQVHRRGIVQRKAPDNAAIRLASGHCV